MTRSRLSVLVVLCWSLSGAGAWSQENELAFTVTEGTWLSLDLSRDGGTVVLELLGDVYALPVSGGRAEVRLSGPAFQSQPRYSPDGERLVFVSDASGSDNLWVSSERGDDPRQVTDIDRATLVSPAWSPDGNTLYATVVRGSFEREAEIWKFDVATGQGTAVVKNDNGRAAPLVSSPAPGAYGAAPTPDGKGLYYTSVTPRPYGSRNGASSAVRYVELESGETRPVPLQGMNAMKPLVFPDGRRLAYAAARDGRTGIKLRDLESGEERWLAALMQRHQLEGRATRDVLPNYAVAPNGESLLVEIAGRIHSIDVAGGTTTLVPFEADVMLELTPSLDFTTRVDEGPVRARVGQHLAVSSEGRVAFSTLGRIWVAPADGSGVTRLTRSERPREFMPAFSPDGHTLAFVTWDETGGHLWIASADGAGEPTRLSAEPAFWVDPAFTPDGKSIVALRAPRASRPSTREPIPADARVVVVPVSGGATRTLGDAAGARFPHFGPDADRVFLTSTSAGLVSVNLGDGNRRVEARMAAGIPARVMRLAPTGAHVVAALGPRLVRFGVPDGGLAGTELSMDAGTPLADEGSDRFAWSVDAASVSWLDGMTLVSADVDQASGSRSEVELSVEVPRPAREGEVVLRGAKIVTMRGDEIVDDGDVLVRGNRIAHVGPRDSAPVAADVHVLDVSGNVIVPGFIDVHGHLGPMPELLQPESSATFSNLSYGITTLRDPQNAPEVFALADMVEVDGVPGPRIYSTGPGIGVFPASANLQSLDDARQVLETYRDDYRTHLLKSYLVGTRQQRQWVVAAAREMGMMPTTEGGADTKGGITHVVDGYSGHEHAFPITPIRDDLVQLVARSGLTYTPTLVVSFGGALPIYRLLAEERPHENLKLARWYAQGELFTRTSTRLLWFPPEDYNDRDAARGAAAIQRAGGRVAIGGHGEVQGLSAHWEMALLARGGMEPHDVLRAATLSGAEAIGLAADLGSVEPGKLADLVVLRRDPLERIDATQSVRFVMRDGVVYDGDTLAEVWPRARELKLPFSLERPADPTDLTARVDDRVRRAMRDGPIPGVAVAIVRGTDVLIAKGYGLANLETDTPVTTRTMFQSGSLGKQWTSAGIMALVEDGRLDLDASIREHLPETPESWTPITIRHLMTHSSGIPDYTSDSFDYSTNYSEDDLVRMAASLELEFEAGARWNYSNTGYVMLGVVLTRVTGMPYWEFLRERVFDPAGMPTIRVNTEAEIVPHRAQGYVPVPGGYRHPGYVAPETNTTADGSMRLSLEDAIAWSRTLHARDVLRPESWDAILEPMTLSSGKPYPYGFGWVIDDVRGHPVQEHGGAWQGFITQLTRFPEEDITVVVLTNSRNLVTAGLAADLAAIVDPALAPEPPPIVAIADPDPVLTELVSKILTKTAAGELSNSDFTFVRRTVFPRMQAALTSMLEGLGSPTRMELLQTRELGDDRVLEHWAWFGERRFRVRASFGPGGGLTGLRVTPEDP